MPSPRRLLLLVVGCVVLGIGVGLMLLADLGSDGFSTLINGLVRFTGWPFWALNYGVSILFLVLAAVRNVRPGLGTIVQITVVGFTVSAVLALGAAPTALVARIGLLAVAFPVLALGIAMYLGTQLGAGPVEAAGLAWDPPFPFRWSYSAIQFGSAAVGWLLGGTIGPVTVAIIVLLGPLVDLWAKVLHLDLHQAPIEPKRPTG